MKCIVCESWSLSMICKQCQEVFLIPDFYKRDLGDGFFVYSFYGFEEIQKLVLTKYEFFGDSVFEILANCSFAKFAQNFEFENEIYVIGIDDHTRHGFSQTAILAKSLKSKVLKPVFGTLRAKNEVKYAGKELDFRLKNPRNFQYSGKKEAQVILVDDIITTGTTIKEAKKVLEDSGCEVLFGLVLCDAQI